MTEPTCDFCGASDKFRCLTNAESIYCKARQTAAYQTSSRQTPTDEQVMAHPKVQALVEALEKLANLGNGDHYGNSSGNVIAIAALAALKGHDK